ncbi:hypothetical protein JCM10914A_42720 [Paenibacillus sp. JCM 10914]
MRKDAYVQAFTLELTPLEEKEANMQVFIIHIVQFALTRLKSLHFCRYFVEM